MQFTGFDQLLTFQSETSPESPAILYAEGSADSPSVLTYREFDLLTRERAAKLAGETDGSVAVLCQSGSLSCITEIFAAVRARRPVILLNETLPRKTLMRQLLSVRASLLWAADPEDKEFFAPCLSGEADPQKKGGQLLFFTSGTTSFSRSAVLTERGLCSSAHCGSSLLALHPGDLLLALLPLDHVYGFVCGLLWGFISGAAIALHGGRHGIAGDCAFYRPTVLSLVPSILQFLLRCHFLNPELHTILTGGAPCPPELYRQVRERGIRISCGYGMTETSSGFALSVGEDPGAMKICESFTVRTAPDGEILVSSPDCIMQGYYNDEKATRAVLTDGVLCTGDLGFLDRKGLLHLTGRKKELLVLDDGTKIFLPEYEFRLRSVLKERDYAVVSHRGRPVLVIFAAEEEKARLFKELRPVMRSLPRGQQLAGIQPVSRPLPRTATGKILRDKIEKEVSL